METIFIILRELEYLKGLVKLARKKKDVEVAQSQIVVVKDTFTIKQVCINKTHDSKIVHLVVEINRTLIKRLVDTIASMSVMATSMVI
jgi:hypothetical protein